MSDLSLDELHVQTVKIELLKNPKMYDFALEQPDGSFNKVTITNNIETKENGQIIIDLNHIAKQLPYSGSEPNKDCDMKQCRNITGDRIQNREIPYIRILQPCNNITGAENRCFYLFEEKEGQSPIRVISNYEVEKLLWPNTQCRWICKPKDGQHYVMFDGKIVYQCTQIEPWGWKLVLQDETAWFTEYEITFTMAQANVVREVAIEALLQNNNIVDSILDLIP